MRATGRQGQQRPGVEGSVSTRKRMTARERVIATARTLQQTAQAFGTDDYVFDLSYARMLEEDLTVDASVNPDLITEHPELFAFTKKTDYDTDMGETAEFIAVAAKEGFSPVELRRLIDKEKAANGEITRRENTTGRVTEPPRQNTPDAIADVYAKAAEKSARRYARHVFSEAELHDPDAINRARDTLADIETARRSGSQISDEQRLAGRWAAAFMRRLRKLDAA